MARVEDKLLGEGSFGCVLQPAIPCKKNKKIRRLNLSKNTNYVSKVFIDDTEGTIAKKAFDIEVKLAERVNQWDPQGQYFGLPSFICTADSADIQKNKAAAECSELDTRKKQFDQIIMPNYGEDVDDYLENYMKLNKQKYPLKHWIIAIKNLLIGVNVLQQNNVVHLDIKHSNVLFDGQTLKLIDFSLARTFDKIYDSKYEGRLKHTYFPYPLEFLVVSYYLYNACYKASDCSIYTLYLQNLNSFGSDGYHNFLQFHSETEILEKISKLQNWISTTSTKVWTSVIYNTVNTIDIYSVGCLCIEINHMLDYSTVTEVIQKKYTQFILHLTEIDCRKRPNSVGALKEYYDSFSSLV